MLELVREGRMAPTAEEVAMIVEATAAMTAIESEFQAAVLNFADSSP